MSDVNIQAGLDLASKQAGEAYSCIIELRQYTLKPGRRDELIALFEERFIEGQEQVGAHVLGQFRRRNRPDQFVWLRGFTDMEARRQALQGFYYGPIWREHRDAANDTMIDSDNVLLFKPASRAGEFRLDLNNRPGKDAPEVAGGIIIATLYTFTTPVEAKFVEFFEKEVVPVLRAAGAAISGYFVTEASENTFPALPVREGEHIFAWFASFVDEAAYESYLSALSESDTWTATLTPALQGWLARPQEVLELLPARRSLMCHHFA
ncbi:NIPSNAP family containing protein [Ktedonobacter sp. SOSP1-52]|uniref:NIPSNAP family protein n=1 Tax=Ktedonobacter sp. SOSP1-52 TaxID=2778366 RepID=UPI001915E414|nr:NIPSNAP family protein [Ktedonobacter sp. SOSP1-52]GHO62271.1 NIPSNAP family containing protein [Ktedonobacter sp. SOSP1-52]